MSGREWKPGDVAMVTRENGDKTIALWGGWNWHCAGGNIYSPLDRSIEPRPLVVIDPEDREQVDRLAKDFHESDHIAPWHDLHSETRAQITDALQAALRSFLEPPKPEEPTDPAVRVKVNGSEWAKVGPWWVCADLGEVPRDWAYLADAVTSDA